MNVTSERKRGVHIHSRVCFRDSFVDSLEES